MIKEQDFGVEVEFIKITRQAAAHAVSRKFGWGTPRVSGKTFTLTDDKNRSWKIMYDGSLNGHEDQRCELVTPILQYEDIETLQEVVRTIRKAGGRVDGSCGVHVHVDKGNHNARSLKNLINIMYSKDDLIYNALGVSSHREYHYCSKVRQSLVDNLKKEKNLTMDRLADFWYEGYSRYGRYNRSRYHGLNLHNVWFAYTVEFRLFNGTLHAGKIKAYIQFCLAISGQAITNKCTRATKTQTDNPKYTFRSWLLRLGLIGDEFKTARLHLMKNLEGDSAYVGGRPAI